MIKQFMIKQLLICLCGVNAVFAPGALLKRCKDPAVAAQLFEIHNSVRKVHAEACVEYATNELYPLLAKCIDDITQAIFELWDSRNPKADKPIVQTILKSIDKRKEVVKELRDRGQEPRPELLHQSAQLRMWALILNDLEGNEEEISSAGEQITVNNIEAFGKAVEKFESQSLNQALCKVKLGEAVMQMPQSVFEQCDEVREVRMSFGEGHAACVRFAVEYILHFAGTSPVVIKRCGKKVASVAEMIMANLVKTTIGLEQKEAIKASETLKVLVPEFNAERFDQFLAMLQENEERSFGFTRVLTRIGVLSPETRNEYIVRARAQREEQQASK